MKKLYVITGTTRGLGKAFLNLLSNNQTKIISINRKEIDCQNRNINIQIDLSKITLNDIQKFETILVEQIADDTESIVFINNAFTMGKLNKIDKLDFFDVEKSINTNFVSSFLLIKSFLKNTKMLKIQKKILNISSGAANNAIDGWSIYCSTKAAMDMYMHSVKLEYPDYDCFNINPGVMDTKMQLLIRDFKAGEKNKYFMELYQKKELKETSIVAQRIVEEYCI